MRVVAMLAAAAVVALTPVVAAAEDEEAVAPTSDVQQPVNSTWFDLGIDVMGVAHTPGAAKAFISGLAQVSQEAIVGACTTYMQHPETMQSPETYAFCINLTG
jgi:hypothetical protein